MICQVNHNIWHTTKPLLKEGPIWWGYKIFMIQKIVFCMEYPHPFYHLCVHTHINILMQAHMTISGACMVWFKLIVFECKLCSEWISDGTKLAMFYLYHH